jgi:hypothetical protein
MIIRMAKNDLCMWWWRKAMVAASAIEVNVSHCRVDNGVACPMTMPASQAMPKKKSVNAPPNLAAYKE